MKKLLGIQVYKLRSQLKSRFVLFASRTAKIQQAEIAVMKI